MPVIPGSVIFYIFSATPEVTALGIPAIRVMSIGFIMAGIDTINATMFPVYW